MPDRTLALTAICVILAVLGCAEEGSSPRSERAERGAAYYSSLCANCHGSNGQGLGRSFPPLAGSEWVTGDEETLIRVVLHGLQGPIEVRGQPYRGLMTGFERQLGDEDLAAILTYVRSSWGNDASPITASEVARVRALPSPGRPLRADDLDRVPRD